MKIHNPFEMISELEIILDAGRSHHSEPVQWINGQYKCELNVSYQLLDALTNKGFLVQTRMKYPVIKAGEDHYLYHLTPAGRNLYHRLTRLLFTFYEEHCQHATPEETP